MRCEDADAVIAMMRTFYSSPAVATNGSEEIFAKDVRACVGDCPYLEGFVFEEVDETIGYAMIAKSFSTEFGKQCVWIEDIYLKSEYRGRGLAGEFFDFLEKKFPSALFRLELEQSNAAAYRAYKKAGFEALGYLEMIK